MKQSKTEQSIINLIKLRQLELATKAAKDAIKAMEDPPKTPGDAMKSVGKTLGYAMRIAQLQRALRIIEPKPNYAKGGIISKKEEMIIPEPPKPPEDRIKNNY